MKKIYLLKFLFLVFLFSCENEIVELDEQSIAQNKDTFKATLVDGRLHFNSVEDIKISVDYIKTLEDETVEAMMYDFYEQGFEPLFPFYNENDEIRIREFVNKKIKRSKPNNIYMKIVTSSDSDEPDDNLSDIEPDDDLIGDDYFAAVLNFDREVVVEGRIHKYTYNGVFLVDVDKKQDLDTYLVQNNINDLNIPDPNTLTRGMTQLTPTVQSYAPEYVSNSCGSQNHQMAHFAHYDAFYNDFVEGSGCGSGYSGGGSSGGSSSSAPDHTASMKNYIKDMLPCDSQNGGVFGWNPFGTSKKCFEYHSSKYRTKTKYWNENLLVYRSIGVKVKHQKKRWWWGTKRTDEIALVINQAVFTATPSYQIPNYNSFPTASSAQNRLFFYDGKFYPSAQSYYVIQGWNPPAGLVPTTPFQDDIIVQEYIDLPILRNINDIEIEAKEINKLFWDKGVWDGAKNLFRHFAGEDPKKVTYIVTTPQKVYIQYVDLSQRKLNDKKIVDILDYDWGGQIKFKFKLGSNGTPTANLDDWTDEDWSNYTPPNVWDNITSSVTFKKSNLTDFETLSMDFVGLTRRGNSWKGSRIVYQKNQ